jgi:hypothetical protein
MSGRPTVLGLNNTVMLASNEAHANARTESLPGRESK